MQLLQARHSVGMSPAGHPPSAVSARPAGARIPGWLRSLARSPLVHFVVLGGAIFAFAPRAENTRRISVSGAGLVALERAQASRLGVASLDPDKAREVDARAIEDEVLYREALRLGLDREDPIVRQRVIQKLLLLVEDLGGASQPPTEAALRAFFDADRERFRFPASYHFVHVFASRAASLPPQSALDDRGVPNAGEPFPYPRESTASRQELAKLFGPDFADAVVALAPGDAFSAPLRSSFGWHRVRLVERVEGRIPTFEEIRGALALDYALARREAVVGDYMKKTVFDYAIDVDGKPLVGFVPTRRVAVRSDPSAED